MKGNGGGESPVQLAEAVLLTYIYHEILYIRCHTQSTTVKGPVILLRCSPRSPCPWRLVGGKDKDEVNTNFPPNSRSNLPAVTRPSHLILKSNIGTSFHQARQY
ncbi:hypothetical protein E2C01_087514 [Portunus trituberculatus]|uniref:Uncharacterized protein n=1 Tax=Portunus trituberculatus TaxID=210409 RepID=A0A5B7JCP1_PORTR|nr:hypothetical protein [Portunus trituberculatus]